MLTLLCVPSFLSVCPSVCLSFYLSICLSVLVSCSSISILLAARKLVSVSDSFSGEFVFVSKILRLIAGVKGLVRSCSDGRREDREAPCPCLGSTCINHGEHRRMCVNVCVGVSWLRRVYVCTICIFAYRSVRQKKQQHIIDILI